MKTLFKNASINYSEAGSGDTLVLLHGFTETLSIWDDFARDLSRYFRVICVDLPGHGGSDCIGEVHSMELMADVVMTVLDKLSAGRCVVIGHSMGGYVALAFARKYGSSVCGLGLFHSSALSDSNQAREGRMRAIEAIRKNHHEFLTAFIPSLFAPENKEIFRKETEILVEQAKKMSKEAVIAAQMGMKERPGSREILLNAKYPVMFISGHQDSRIPVNDLQHQLLLPETTYSLLLKNCGHMGYLEKKEKTLGFVKCFTHACYNKIIDIS